MRRYSPLHIVEVILAALVLIACTGKPVATAPQPTEPMADAGVAPLLGLGEQAAQLARQEAAEALLLQIDTNLIQTSFRFRDLARTKEIYVGVPAISAPPDQWTVRIDPVSMPAPGFDLQALLVGPQRAAASMLAQWPACGNLLLTLFGEASRLEWTGFCTLPEGVVSARIDNDTGVLVVLGGPAQPPATALPVPATSAAPAPAATEIPVAAAQTIRSTFDLTGEQSQEIAVFIDFIRAYNNGRFEAAFALLAPNVSISDCDYRAVKAIVFDGKTQAGEWLRDRLADHDRFEIKRIANENQGEGGEHVVGVEFSNRASALLEELGFSAGITPKLAAKVVFATEPTLIQRFANGPFGGDQQSCRPGD